MFIFSAKARKCLFPCSSAELTKENDAISSRRLARTLLSYYFIFLMVKSKMKIWKLNSS